ncbi:alpha/beta hydrolase [Fructilactobacillus cliffordii]|uniref:Alpha/beta hydrolase n=1 Tax=Fructilactobacillus cliffordii TaxID=2940299 RepID=A0A9Q9E1Y5_9LACO|nr:alpha/beta hydrolase [Fructilactobacillus cliffordii]USS89225.1 alpha/beta hydrolase [Fructilactobacillus cliffordii]
MNKKRFNKWDLIVLIIGVSAAVFGFFYMNYNNGQSTGGKMHKPMQSPIIFVSDQNRTSAAAQHLVTTASRSGGSVAMHIDVLANGDIQYNKNGNVKAKQPIIEVNFSDRTKTTHEQAKSLNKILRHLNHKYDYEQYDAIGFGSGSLTVFSNATRYGVAKNGMRLQHFISVAGPYQGVKLNVPPLKQGQAGNQTQTPVNRQNGVRNNNQRPNDPQHPVQPTPEMIQRQQILDRQQAINDRHPSYAELKRLSKKLDPNTQVLNIYGVVDNKSNSDGLVPASSATALKNLVPSKNYESLRLTGPMAEHSQIIDNQISERIINRFLFNE